MFPVFEILITTSWIDFELTVTKKKFIVEAEDHILIDLRKVF
jgi:hypothetical protein